MARGAVAIRGLPDDAWHTPATSLTGMAEALRRAIAGSSGPFYATALLRAARELNMADPAPEDWARAFRAAVASIANSAGQSVAIGRCWMRWNPRATPSSPRWKVGRSQPTLGGRRSRPQRPVRRRLPACALDSAGPPISVTAHLARQMRAPAPFSSGCARSPRHCSHWRDEQCSERREECVTAPDGLALLML